jgi:phosphatidylserine decarboxylase
MNKYLTFFTVALSLFMSEKLNAITPFDEKQEESVRTVYAKWYSKPVHALLTSYKWPSVIAGKLADTRLSSLYIPLFMKKYGLSEDDFEQPLRSYRTFNEFFSRKLKPAVRTITHDEHAIASPADGAALVIQNIGNSTQFPIKGVLFDLNALLKDKELAAEFNGGTAFVIRLAPWDYHRLHFPLAGRPEAPQVIHGKYESVHPFVYSRGIQPLTVNERHLILYQTETVGTIALIPVGALFVGAITETYTVGQQYHAGDEMAYFSFGGSTVVLLFKKDTITVSEEIILNSSEGKETAVKMGQTIAQSQSMLL